MKLNSLNKGLLGYWPLDRKHSRPGVSLDVTPYGNHGTHVGTLLNYVPDRYGQDDGGIYINRGVTYINPGFITLQRELTLTWWFNTTYTGSHNTIFDFSTEIGHFDLNHTQTTNRPLLYLAGSNYMYFSEVAQNYLDGNWHFMELYIPGSESAATGDSEFRIDNNIIPQTGGTQAQEPQVWDQFWIGRTGNYGSMSGSISEVRMYNRAIIDNERDVLMTGYKPKVAITQINKQSKTYSSPDSIPGLVGHWPMTDEYRDGDLILDNTKYQSHATIGSGSASLEPNRFGIDDKATGLFADDTSFISSSDPSIPITKNFTVCFFGKIDVYDASGAIPFTLNAPVQSGLFFQFGTGTSAYAGQFISGGAGTYNTFTTATVPADSTWRHHAWVMDNDNVQTRMYTNTLLRDEEVYTWNDDFVDGLKSINFGRYYVGVNWSFSGSLADVRIYQGALTVEQLEIISSSFLPSLKITP